MKTIKEINTKYSKMTSDISYMLNLSEDERMQIFAEWKNELDSAKE